MPQQKQYFIGQRKDEEVLYMSRRHWIPMYKQFIRNLFLSLIWIILVNTIIIGVFYMYGYELDSHLYTFLGILSALFILPTISTTWTVFYLTLIVITDNRMVKITQRGVFYNYMREIKLRGLQDTSYTFKTWIQSMFNYGTLVAHAASGEEGKFKVSYLPNPRAVHNYLNQLSKILHDMDTTGQKIELPKFDENGVWEKTEVKEKD